jgi:hypothetical protein
VATDSAPEPSPTTDRITRWLLVAIGVYTGLLVTLLNFFLLGSGKPVDRAVILPFPFVVLAAPVVLLREWLGVQFLPGVD